MTTTEAYELGQRALAAGFQWRPGCVAIGFYRRPGSDTTEGDFSAVHVGVDDEGYPSFCTGPTDFAAPLNNMAPDVRDVGAIAHMLAQLRERAGASFYLWRDVVEDAWEVRSDTPSYLVSGVAGTHAKTQGGAIVLALELTHRGGF